MTRDELVEFCKFGLNVNDSQLDDSISDESWVRLIQSGYRKAWSDVRIVASREATVEAVDLTWSPLTFTFELPLSLRNATIFQIVSIDASGRFVGDFPGYFETRNVLRMRYGTAPTNVYFRVYYIPECETLIAGNQSPVLIPPQHHEVIAWEALRLAKIFLDKEIPPSWEKMLDERRMNFHKEFSVRPIADVARIRLPNAPMIRPAY